VLPTNEVKTLESFVDEIEGMSAIGKDTVGLGREQQIRQGCRSRAHGDGGQHCTLGCLAMPHGAPTPQPALERARIGSAGKSCALPARCRTVTIGRDPTYTVEQRQVGVLLRQDGQKVPEGSQDGHARAPARKIFGAEECGLAHNLERGHAGRQLALHGLRDDEPKIVGHAVF
jgi:hypothetical protein